MFNGFRPLSLLLFLAAALARPAAGQTPLPAPAEKEKVWTYVEKMPQPPGGGGAAAVVALIQQRITYPARAERAQAEGRVFVSFTVATSGLVQDAAIVKGFRFDCDSAVLQAVQQLPRFEPGTQAGKTVPVRFTAPITFRLQAPAAPVVLPDDSLRVYTYVQYMPEYRGEIGVKRLTEDLIRNFKAACKAAGCAVPGFPVVADIRIGPSGVVQDVVSVNNMPAGTLAEVGAGKQVGASPTSLPRLSPACEAALLAAGRLLPRLTPGSMNGRRVTVGYTLRLVNLDR